MEFNEISKLRLLNQKIESTAFADANSVVSWMGAMQAQDYLYAKWAVGQRMLNVTDEKIESALNKGEIIRTHVLRPTWHFVSAGDVYWMLALTAPRIKASMKSRNRELELTQEVFAKSLHIIESELFVSKHLTREQIAEKLKAASIKTDENRLSHILMEAELEALICSGIKAGNKLTYSLLSERVSNKKIMSKDESLAELAKRYFTSHGPATVKDFGWWSGLAVTEAQKALDFVKPHFVSEKIGSETFFCSNASFEKTTNSMHLLPAFDEFLISYKDRRASLSLTHNSKAVSTNGIFRPVIIIDGQVVGIWKRTKQKAKISIETSFFVPVNKTNMELINQEAESYGKFLNEKVEIVHSDSMV